MGSNFLHFIWAWIVEESQSSISIEMGSDSFHFLQSWIVKELLHLYIEMGLISSISYELGWIVEESLHFDQLGIGFAPFPTSLDCWVLLHFDRNI
jgi:hypothetical protein